MHIKCPVILSPSFRKNSIDVIFSLEHVLQSTKKSVFYLDGTNVWVDWFWWLIRLYFDFNLVTRFCILPSRIALHVVSSRCNFTIKWVHFINVLWYKEALSLKDLCHKIFKTIISKFSNSNAKQKQQEIEITGTIFILLFFYFFRIQY